MYYEAKTWTREPLLNWIMEECNLLDCATDEEIERVGKFINSHLCSEENMVECAKMIGSYSKPQCNMVDFVAWILTEISNHCVNRVYWNIEQE